MTDYLLPTATSVEERVRDAEIALLPVGSFEQHGAILPLATDTVIAVTVARAVAERHDVLQLPPVTISCSHEHAAWRGTVSISATTLHAIVTEVAESLRTQGIRKLVVVSGHGGNYVLGNVVQEASARGHKMALFPTENDWAAARRDGGVELTSVSDMHAGELETSILLHAHPSLVRPDYAEHDHLADDRERFLTRGLAAYTASGVIGRPSLASAAKGRGALTSLAASFADVVAALDS
ncbi:creatininase family protein [Actinophytocola gossypii]|uniref:Creatininase family protein n=1 Tax=Actinophytocola gossypii TaxID=2812003 RepID=A0ABT2J190_9PSEU|nr:creatininase family protein [Actinophytocola gossypii]MCT2581623.1 creatininase family protein [Actinophytocola gossypii]